MTYIYILHCFYDYYDISNVGLIEFTFSLCLDLNGNFDKIQSTTYTTQQSISMIFVIVR